MSTRSLALLAVLLWLAPLRAQGAIAFLSAEPLPVAAVPDFTAAADLNRDGRADMVVVSPASKQVQIYLGDARAYARLVAAGTYSFGVLLRGVAVGDLDGDGWPDLACVDQAARGVWILRGRGDGTFLDPTLSPSQASAPYAIALADLDGVSGLDLIVTDVRGDRVHLSLNLGTTPPTFRRGGDLTIGDIPRRVLAVDVSGDGRADIVTLTNGAALPAQVGVARFRRVVQGFPEFAAPQRYPIDGKASDLLAAELSGDGALDLALLTRPGGSGASALRILRNDGDGQFSPPVSMELACPFFTAGSPCRALALAAADVNRDNRTDLIVALNDPRQGPGTTPSLRDALQVFGGRGNGSFVPGPVYAIDKQPTTITLADVGGDCLPDVVVASARYLNLQVLVNQSGGSRAGNGAPCSEPDACLSGRCTDGRCCGTTCYGDERCDVAGFEGICRPPLRTPTTCEREADCAAVPGQPFCADGLCCDFACLDGRCDLAGFEGLCIPGIADGEACDSDARCASGFCADNLRCCREACAGGYCDQFGVCHRLSPLAAGCGEDAECASQVCDRFDAICCDRRCNAQSERCELTTGLCGSIPATPLLRAAPRQTPTPHIAPVARPRAAAADPACAADCDGDGQVGIAELVRLVGAALGSDGAAPCSAVVNAPTCVTISDVVRAVSQALRGC